MVLLTFPGARFTEFMSLLPEEWKSRFLVEVADQMCSVLKLLPIFEGIPADRITDLSKLFHFEIFKEGEHVIREGMVSMDLTPLFLPLSLSVFHYPSPFHLLSDAYRTKTNPAVCTLYRMIHAFYRGGGRQILHNH